MNIALVWDDQNSRGDWQIVNGRTSTGHLLTSAVVISIFTDRVAQPDYVPVDGSGDPRGWWCDTLDGVPIGSRLWQLRRSKIVNRLELTVMAKAIIEESLQWLLDAGIASSIAVTVTAPPSVPGFLGTMLIFEVQIAQPTGPAPLIRLLWKGP